MRLEQHTVIETWTEDHLSSLPDEETDFHEYKSSLISVERLKKEITIAASAFWNTGGGLFIAGIDDYGHIDGGIPMVVGSQKVRDWADQILAHVEPTGPYAINIIEPGSEESPIKPDHVVLVIAFGESASAPHMAPDYRYYVRAGTHSLPAGHYLVEAIRSRRNLNQPLLRGLLRLNESKSDIVQLIVLAANEVTALDVELSFDPVPNVFAGVEEIFPLKIPVIDRDNPFSMDLLKPFMIHKTFGDRPIFLELEYKSVGGKTIKERQLLDPFRSLSPVRMAAMMWMLSSSRSRNW